MGIDLKELEKRVKEDLKEQESTAKNLLKAGKAIEYYEKMEEKVKSIDNMDELKNMITVLTGKLKQPHIALIKSSGVNWVLDEPLKEDD